MDKQQMVSVPRASLEQWQKEALQWKVDSIGVGIMHALAQPAEQHQGEPVKLPARTTDTESCCEMLRRLGLYGDVNVWNAGKIWNACLDEIAKLGPLYTRPAQSDPVAWRASICGLWEFFPDKPSAEAALTEWLADHTPDDLAEIAADGLSEPSPLYTRADPAEVERLRSIERSHGLREALLEQVKGERDRMIARTLELADQLANQDALLRKGISIANGYDLSPEESDDQEAWITLCETALSASAEPSAPLYPKCTVLKDANVRYSNSTAPAEHDDLRAALQELFNEDNVAIYPAAIEQNHPSFDFAAWAERARAALERK